MKPRPRGFTLPEVLMALFIISTGLLGFAWMFAGTLNASHQNAAQDVATRLLADVHERLAVNLIDASAIAAWRATTAAQLPALPDSPARADLQLEFATGGAASGLATLRWGTPSQATPSLSALYEVLPTWSAP